MEPARAHGAVVRLGVSMSVSVLIHSRTGARPHVPKLGPALCWLAGLYLRHPHTDTETRIRSVVKGL